MALRPQDIYQTVEADETEIKRLEQGIDSTLKATARFRGGAITFGVEAFGKDLVIREELFKRYRAAGWQIKQHSDQREGDYIMLVAPSRETHAQSYIDPRDSYPGR